MTRDRELKVENGRTIRSTEQVKITVGKMENNRKENVLKDKPYRFALRIVKAYKHLSGENREYVLWKQLLRSGTPIGANVAETNQAQSRPDLIGKLSISLKETVETEYWLSLLRDGDFLTPSQADSLIMECSESKAILTASIKSAKQHSF